MPICNTNPVGINIVAHPRIPWGSDRFAGPYPRNGKLYALARDSVSSSPQIWKSTDSGVTWTALLTEGTITWGQWVWAWDPGIASNLITVLSITSTSAAQLVDFDLDTETWGTPYATTGGPAIKSGAKSFVAIGRLSNGTIKAFYIDNGSGALNYAEANIGGSGIWDTTGTQELPNSFFRDAAISRNVECVTVDASDRCRGLVSQTGSNPHLIDYFDLSSGNVVGSTVSLSTPANVTQIHSLRVLPDGNLYAPGTANGKDFVYCWVGTSAIPPVFTRELVADLTVDPTTSGPGFAVVTYIGSKPMVVWNTIYATGSDTFDLSARDPVTGWSARQIYLDLDVNFPQPPIVSGGLPWITEGLTIDPVSATDLGVVIALDTGSPNSGVMAFYTQGTVVAKKRGHAF